VKNTSDTRVRWQVNGTTGGNSTVGTISATGLYKAPSKLPAQASVTVRAVSLADTSKAATAQVLLTR
jgi:hypothetical protein